MKKNKDKIVYLLLTLTVIFLYIVITRNKYVYGSLTDWENQHYLIPEYFRNLFYKTGDLFPDFAFNLGAGQNIYYFSYYGLLSPIILISYLFPMIKMMDYIIISSLISSLISSILFYNFLKNHNYNQKISFLGAFLFICSGPLLFHTHRHIMFVSYMPFLILGLMSVDKFFNTKKISSLIISVFLMVMTNYYYSVSSIFVLIIYSIYLSIKNNDKIKQIIINIFKIAKPIIIAVMMASIIILPTLYTLLNGREISEGINILTLFIPKISFNYLLYKSYGIGLTLISLIGIIYSLKTNKKEIKFLAIISLLISIFPIFNYILNGTLYIDSKSLIPFLPLVLIVSANFINEVLSKKIDYKYLYLILILLIFTGSILIIIEEIIFLIFILIYKKNNSEKLFVSYIILVSLVFLIITNLSDRLVLKSSINLDNPFEQFIDDDNIYRIKDLTNTNKNINSIKNISEYKATIYSSTFNKKYNNFYYEEFNNPVPYRNKSMTVSSNNELFSIFMGEKYIISDHLKPFDSKIIKKYKNYKLYKNDNVLPIGYARSNLLNYDEYKKQTYPNNVISLLSNIVVSKNSSNSNELKLEKHKLNYKIIKQNFKYDKIDNTYKFKINKIGKMRIKINEDMKNQILFIRFKNLKNNDCKSEDTIIKINDIKNKLTCSTWKYHNQNYIFDYVIYDTNKLDILISKGEYELSDIEIYKLDYNKIKHYLNDVDEFKFDKDKTKGDKIVGSIDVREDGYFNMSIPYDKGFKILVDNKKTEYEETNISFIGFEIKKGTHKIEIEYEAPYKKQACIISLIGLIILSYYLVKERGEKNGNTKSRKFK